ncbi:MAG: MraY family glycosyltransferase [Anaerolineae bacterium]
MAVLVLMVALLFAVGVTPLVRQLALRINFVAVPKQDRLHTVVTPLMGGVALYIGLVGSILLLTVGATIVSESANLDTTFPFGELLMVMFVGTLLAGIGLWDDWRALDSKVKLGLQLIPVVLLALTTDVQIAMPVPEALNFLLTVCWFLYLINAYNYTDNMDGIAAMIATVAGIFFTVIAVITGQFLVASLAAAIAGTSFGFLRYNLFDPQRKIFMGDVGTMFIGFLLAVIGLKLSFAAESPWVTWPVPVLVLGVPIFDTGMVFISRWRRGQSFLAGGTDHLSHRLSRLDLGRYGTPFAVGLLGMCLGSVALIVMHSSLENSIAAQIFVALLALYALYRLEFKASYLFRTGKQEPVKVEPEPQPEEAQAVY